MLKEENVFPLLRYNSRKRELNGESADRGGTAKREITYELFGTARRKEEGIMMLTINEPRSNHHRTIGHDGLAYQGFTMSFFAVLSGGVGRMTPFRQLGYRMYRSMQEISRRTKLFPVVMRDIMVMRTLYQAGNQDQ